MSIFKKNPNEVLYPGGQKHWTDVLKNSGPGEVMIWRQPEEDFNDKSTLIVMPGESAIFVNCGKIEYVAENGTYILSTQNFPFLSRLRNAFSGGISRYNCVVYFVRSADTKELRWGTATPIQVRDKVWGVRTDVRVRGIYKLRIADPAKFLSRLLGNNVQFGVQEELDNYFAGEFQGKIKSEVSKFLNSLEQELIGIDAYMDEISQKIKPSIDTIVSEYGLACVSFALAGIDVDKTKYDTLDEAQMQLIARTKGYQGDKAGLDILGGDWSKVQGVEIMKSIANNPGTAGDMVSAGAGFGMGMGMAGAMGTIAQQVFSPMGNFASPAQPEPPKPAEKKDSSQDAVELLTKLKQMLDAGLIEQSEYDAKKAEVLSAMMSGSAPQTNQPPKNADPEKIVFISYSSKELQVATQIRMVLEANGINCWMAPKSIPAGSDYGTEIPKAIEKCKVLLLILSEQSQQSQWVPKEIGMAIGLGKVVVPFHIDNSTITEAFNFYLTNSQRIDAYNRSSDVFQELTDRIKGLLNN